MPRFTQDDRLLKVTTPLGDDVLLIDHLFGAESVSSPFRIDLRCFSEESDLHLKDLMGQGVTVEMGAFDGSPRYFHGHVTSFAHAGSDGGFTFYEVKLGPWTDFLRRRKNCRIFQELKVEDILREVFADYGALAVFDIKVSSRDLLTMCIQYNETDFSFICRLMEGLGWYYYFEFDDGSHKLIVDKDSTGAPNMPIQSEIEFNDTPGSDAQDAIDRFESNRELVPNKIAVKTFDFKNPRDPLLAKTDTQHQMGDLPDMEWYEFHGPYTFKEFEEGDDLAQLHMEDAETRSKGFRGSGNCRALTCGHAFTLENHYLYDGEFFVLSVQHHGSNNYFEQNPQEVYRNTFTAIRKSIPYRCPRVTERPVMRGPQSATVVGPDGEEIYCDKYGRIKVQFHWDREGQFNDQSSCWVRLAMPWAGSNFGFMSLPRIGQEVLVDFLEGDPDLPIAVASIYNELNMPPWDLPANKTQSGMLSRSSKSGTPSHANALRFEDKKNQEEVWLHAERNQRIEVEVDESHSVGHDRSKTIGNDETTTIERDRTEHVKRHETITVDKNRTETVGLVENVTIGQSRTISVGTSETITIAASQSVTVGASKSETVGASSSETVGATKTLTVGAAFALSAPMVAANVSATMVTTVGGAYTLNSPMVSISASGATVVNCPSITLTSGAGTVTLAGGVITVSGATVNITGSGMVNVTGGLVKLNC
jgi:type VI secretion system secreted protein VgrG